MNARRGVQGVLCGIQFLGISGNFGRALRVIDRTREVSEMSTECLEGIREGKYEALDWILIETEVAETWREGGQSSEAIPCNGKDDKSRREDRECFEMTEAGVQMQKSRRQRREGAERVLCDDELVKRVG